jgi:hypothetical protein
VTVIPFTTHTTSHPAWCDPARCWTDPADGAAMHESSRIRVGGHVVSIMGGDEDPPTIQLDDETLSPHEAQLRAVELEQLAAELRRHVNAANGGAPGPITTGA